MNATDTAARLASEGHVWSIGQLEPDACKYLSREVRAKRVNKHRVWWPWVHSGTIRKTVYVRADLPVEIAASQA